jgi:hypothetical protein
MKSLQLKSESLLFLDKVLQETLEANANYEHQEGCYDLKAYICSDCTSTCKGTCMDTCGSTCEGYCRGGCKGVLAF